jgi:hypothetical protein
MWASKHQGKNSRANQRRGPDQIEIEPGLAQNSNAQLLKNQQRN